MDVIEGLVLDMEDKLEHSILVVWVDLSTTPPPVLALAITYSIDLRAGL